MSLAQIQPSRRVFSFILSLLICIIVPVRALYFYIDGTTPKCFYEDLPKDTLVVGMYRKSPTPTVTIAFNDANE